MDGSEAPSRRILLVLVALGTLSGGCQFLSSAWIVGQSYVPASLPPEPTLEQLIDAVNRNSLQIQTFLADKATMTGPGLPTLRANVAFERPRRLRVRAETALSGPELDLGSNDELFWIWVRRNEPEAIYYCRHEQFASAAARRVIPIDPAWLIEALGIHELDPALPHQGPFPVAGGRWAVRTIRETAGGPRTKVTVIDGRSGRVLEQHIYDWQGSLAASAVVRKHRQDPLTGLVMPSVVDIRCPKAELALRIDLGNVQINRPVSNPLELWNIPAFQGVPMVDLCDPRLQFGSRSGTGRTPRQGSRPGSGWRPASGRQNEAGRFLW